VQQSHLLGKKGPTSDQLFDAVLTDEDNDGVISKSALQTGTTIQELQTLVQKLNTALGSSLKTEIIDTKYASQTEYFKAHRRQISSTKFPIIMVQITPIGYHKYELADFHDVHHWIVMTGFSSDWNKGNDWQWVRIFNPASNDTEYYSATELYFSHQQWYTTDSKHKHYGDDKTLWLWK
jgi:hypothetical protein